VRENPLDQLRLLDARNHLQAPPQRTHCSISMPNTRLRRRAQFIRTSFGSGGSEVTARLPAPAPFLLA
jgi:hypothetical protein